jgi:MoxR-like ATPase
MAPSPPLIPLTEVARLGERIVDEVERAVVGKRNVLELLFLALLADGHVLIEDLPGLAKTLMARSFGHATGLRFSRVQFTPDLMPMDVTGAPVLDRASGNLVFRPGPIFAGLLLADEINRAPAKTQAALLEAMQERQVTVDGITHPLDRPFLVIATQNPIEYEGTYPLPEAQLDRFLARITVGYPEPGAEWQMLADRMTRRTDEIALDQIVDAATLRSMQVAVESVHLDEDIGRYIVDLVTSTRRQDRVLVGASPRGSLAVMKMARARAALAGRDFVTPDDVKSVATPALTHRLILRPELWVRDITSDDVLVECLEAVPTPPTRRS